MRKGRPSQRAKVLMDLLGEQRFDDIALFIKANTNDGECIDDMAFAVEANCFSTIGSLIHFLAPKDRRRVAGVLIGNIKRQVDDLIARRERERGLQ